MDKYFDNEIRKHEKEFQLLVKESLKIEFNEISTNAVPISGYLSITLLSPVKNKILSNTPYFFNESKKIIHFTTLKALYSIINEGCLRLYNLHNSDDANEYNYAITGFEKNYELLNFNNRRFSDYKNAVKEYSFITSFTHYENLNNLNFWEKYGDKKQGVTIEFEMIDDPIKWEYFFISKVKHNELDFFDEFKIKWSDLQNRFQDNKYFIVLNQIFSLHKSKEYMNEEEIRLMTINPAFQYSPFYRESFEKLTYNDFKSKQPENNKIKYFKLPLCNEAGRFTNELFNEEQNKFWSLMPKIKISHIYLGPEFPVKANLQKYQDTLKHYISEKMNCCLNISKVSI